ncbi:MAG: hypothetical protein ACR2FF_09125 [Mycobacteriales bacterium]
MGLLKLLGGFGALGVWSWDAEVKLAQLVDEVVCQLARFGQETSSYG